MRLFTGIPVSKEVADELAALVSALRPLAKLNWSPPANYHITTKFIGEWPEEKLEQVTGALLRVTPPAPFEIAVERLGFFPNSRAPRVFCAGVTAAAELGRLARATEEQMAGLGSAPEPRPYSPHLTLARIKPGQNVDAIRKRIEGEENRRCGAFRVTSFHLYASRPGPAGTTYEKLATSCLK